ncbi:MAG: hypothetical protein AMXMBFR7_31990 [Planctomycetota bacterium]
MRYAQGLGLLAGVALAVSGLSAEEDDWEIPKAKPEVRHEGDKGERPEHAEKGERGEHAEKGERGGMGEKERGEKGEMGEKGERPAGGPADFAGFSGRVAGVVLDKKEGFIKFKVEHVKEVWKDNRAANPQALAGQTIVVGAAKNQYVQTFINRVMESNNQYYLEISHLNGEVFKISELNEEQRAAVKHIVGGEGGFKREGDKREGDKREGEKHEAEKREAEKREAMRREAEKREAEKREGVDRR